MTHDHDKVDGPGVLDTFSINTAIIMFKTFALVQLNFCNYFRFYLLRG